jgi:hypothetical protein
MTEWLRHDFTVVHAGSVALDGHGILFPAASGRGKSTLVALLIAHGFDYVSDDTVAFDPVNQTLHAFPKHIAIKPGSLRVLTPYYPALVSGPCYRWDDETVWYIKPPTYATPESAPVLRSIVLPTHKATGPSRLLPMRRGSVLQILLPQLFEPRSGPKGAIPAALSILSAARCFELEYHDVHDAVKKLRSLCVAMEDEPPLDH